MNNLKRVSEISMDGDSIKYEQGSVSQNQHVTTSQNQNDKMSFTSGSNISDSCLYYATNTKTQGAACLSHYLKIDMNIVKG